jgi:predicted RNA-binding Zn-ribbon protein involved in translation (DUF1610 family)
MNANKLSLAPMEFIVDYGRKPQMRVLVNPVHASIENHWSTDCSGENEIEGDRMEYPNCTGEIAKSEHGNKGNIYHCRKCGTIVYRRNI